MEEQLAKDVFKRQEYNGLWEAILVRPLALVILKFGYLFNNFGISVMFVGLLIRLILLPFSLKSMRQTNNMQKAQPEIARIEKKDVYKRQVHLLYDQSK